MTEPRVVQPVPYMLGDWWRHCESGDIGQIVGHDRRGPVPASVEGVAPAYQTVTLLAITWRGKASGRNPARFAVRGYPDPDGVQRVLVELLTIRDVELLGEWERVDQKMVVEAAMTYGGGTGG